MVCRYFFEYGEVSNSKNFTMVNIILYLGVVPIFILLLWILIRDDQDSDWKVDKHGY